MTRWSGAWTIGLESLISFGGRFSMAITRTLALLFFAYAGIQFMTLEHVQAADLKVGDKAPIFAAKTQAGADFDLSARKGSWTVLYFYPKAGTPGCTKQACAFRDSIDQIRAQGGDVFGISADTVAEQAAFHKEHSLNFTLLADADSKIINLYGSKMPMMKMSKRWTFIVDPELKIRWVEKDVDPAMDAKKVADEITRLKGK
jgi:peroxiredoxin Q/BCP